jgi:hypothetical protein
VKVRVERRLHIVPLSSRSEGMQLLQETQSGPSVKIVHDCASDFILDEEFFLFFFGLKRKYIYDDREEESFETKYKHEFCSNPKMN